MAVIRVVDPDAVRPMHVVMLILLALTLAGSCLLTSGPQATLEGAKDWHEESPLRAIVHVLNLNYSQTTAQGVAVKSLVLGLGASVAALVCGLGAAVRSRGGEEVAEQDTVITRSPGSAETEGTPRRQLSPLHVAQALMVAYVAWSFLSAMWSTSPDIAIGGSALLAIGAIWSLGLGRGLNRTTAYVGACVLLAVCAVTAILAIAYHGERNSIRRASYPIGNPLFLAACLLPGVMLSIGLLGGTVRACARDARAKYFVVIALCVAANGLILWAIWLTSSRSASIAAVVGLSVLLWFVVPKRSRLPIALASMVFLVGIALYAWPRFTAPSPTGRDASLRLRAYAWWYAIDMISEARVLGHGQGAFTQFGDALAADDVIDAPRALDARIAHAHNEWLETCADLGPIGLTLILGALVMTVVAGFRALPGLPNDMWRWTLAAMMASLVAIAVEECADTGLRIAGLPTVFHSLLGLIWALSNEPRPSPVGASSRGPLSRGLIGGGSGVLAMVVLWAAMGDFRSARASFDVLPALHQRAFDEAVQNAELATRYRLSPQRRLAAFEGLCRTNLYVAREYQTESLGRHAKAHAAQPPDAQLVMLAAADRERSEWYIAKARGAFDALIRRAPSYWGAGWLEFRLYQLRQAFADLDGDVELSSRIVTAAGDALKRELKRKPHDAGIALTYAAISGDRIELRETLNVLARPLRYGSIPPGYVEFLSTLSNTEGFNQKFIPIWDEVKDSSDGLQSRDPLAPEKLRLAALIRFLRDDYARAAETARMAMRAYDSVVGGNMGKGACSAALADYSFFAEPGEWQTAIAHADQAITQLPRSTPGRQLAATIKNRIVTYYLAGGDERSARRVLGELTANHSESFIATDLSAKYAVLCKNLIRRNSADLPDDYTDWINRALELDARNELAWRLNAQVAFDDERFRDSVTSLRRALEHGADPRTVYAFAQLALSTQPDDEDFQTLHDELRAFLTGTSPDGEAALRSESSAIRTPR